MILYIINQSNQVVIKRWVIVDDQMKETDPPAEVAPNKVLVLQPYGSLFFASAPVFEEKLPNVTEQTRNSVVILRLRGRSDLGSTFMDVLLKYATALRDQESDLMVVSEDENMHEQLTLAGIVGVAGAENIYTSDEWLGKTVKRAYQDAVARVEANAAQQADTAATDPDPEPPAPEARDGDPLT
jgi:SulP family sulfate permease